MQMRKRLDPVTDIGRGRPGSGACGMLILLQILLLSASAAISKVDPTLLTNGSPMTEAARVYADYLSARNLALAVVVLLLLAIRARRRLAGLMILVALIQLLDVGDDLARRAWLLFPDVLVFAIVFLLGARRLLGQALWHVAAWREQ